MEVHDKFEFLHTIFTKHLNLVGCSGVYCVYYDNFSFVFPKSTILLGL